MELKAIHSYAVKEMYYTLQGEGAHAGRPAVFCRFAGCNLWSGREEDRSTAVCTFCDTDFRGTDGVNGGRYSAADLAERIASLWPNSQEGQMYVVMTGGEPMLQVDETLIQAIHAYNFEIGIETNGTIPVPKSIDWICVSPKANAEILQQHGHELKLVFPQDSAMPSKFEALAFDYFFLQPMDGPQVVENTSAAIEYCLRHPRWRLSLQTHKLSGIP